MNNDDIKKCGCGCSEEEHDHNEGHDCGCGCNEQDHECGCGCSEHEHETMMVELEDENGNIVECEVVDGFVYKDNEYAIVQNPEDEMVYLFKVVGESEEVAELVIPDDEEFEEVTKYYENLPEDSLED